MKIIGFILLVIAVVRAEEDKCQGAYLREIHERCVVESGGDRSAVYDFIHFEKSRNIHGRDYRGCIFINCKYLLDDGHLDPNLPQRFARILHGGHESKIPKIEKVVAKCMASQSYYGDTAANIAEELTNCIAQSFDVGLKLYGVFD